MNTIDQLEKTSTKVQAIVYEKDHYQILLIAGIIALIIAFLLRYTLLREIS